MRILHVVPFFHPAHIYGGPIPVLFEFCGELTRFGCEVKVLTTNANGAVSTLDVSTSRELNLSRQMSVRYCKRIAGDAVAPALLTALLKYVQWADVVHLSIVYSFPTIPCLLACRLFSKPLVWSPMGGLQRWKGSRRLRLKSHWDRVCRLASPRSLTLHVTSELEGIESSVAFPRARFCNIPHGVHIPAKKELRTRTDTLRLLFLGRLDPKKGLENLLDACRILNLQNAQGAAHTYGDWSLIIAGTGTKEYTAALRNRIRELDLAQRVYMVGQVQDECKENLFAQSDMLVVPSHTENFANVVVEALSRGVPVLASTGTPWKRLEDFGCGRWVDNNPESLAAAIAQMSSRDLNEMGERGRKWMEDQFAWPVITGQMIALYRESLMPNAWSRRDNLASRC